MSDRAGITVVIPAYGPGPHLEKAVAALRNQSPPVSRIVISHSGEGDPTSRFAGEPGVTVLHSAERLYAGAARNRGLAHVETEWVAFLDEDMIADPGWHAALQAAIARGDADCIVGSIGSAASGGYWGTSLWFAEFGSVHPYLPPCFFSAGPSANMAVRRDALSAVGGFPGDWPLGEELVMQARLEERGHAIRFEPAACAGHMNVPGFRYTMKHNYPLGRGSAEVRIMFPHLRGSKAVRWPVLSLGLWVARMAQIYKRVFAAQNGPRASLLYHTPGILMAVLAWNFGFAAAAFGKARAKHIPAPSPHSAGMEPVVSVVTVSLNALADLRKTVASVASQEGCNVEHVIVDGASTDGTPGFLASLKAPSIRWISEPDTGIYDAMNKAVRLAKGDYVLALNAGDTFLGRGSLAEAVRHLDGADDIVAFDVRQTDGEKPARFSHRSVMHRLGLKIPFPHQGCFIRRGLFARIGMYDVSYRVAADYEFELRAIRNRCTVKRVPAALTYMPMGGISTRTDSASVRKRFNEERRVQFAHSPNIVYTLFLHAFWPLYLGYRGTRGATRAVVSRT